MFCPNCGHIFREPMPLTPTELEIISFWRQGIGTQKIICEYLGIAKNTLDNHTSNIYKKMGIRSKILIVEQIKVPERQIKEEMKMKAKGK